MLAIKVPEPMFAVINPVMRCLMRSPLHSMLSDSILLISFTGRRSGKQFTTPVRYIEDDGVIHSFSSKDTQWWRNLEGGADVTLRVKGEDRVYRANVLDDPDEIRGWLSIYLDRYPEDAVYHDVGINKNGTINILDFRRACGKAVVVEAVLKQ